MRSTRPHALWLRSRLDWRLGGGWRLSNETFGYDALRQWKNADTYGFDAARGLVTRAVASITHDHQFYGNRLTLASDRRFGGRRNRLTMGVETTRNTFYMPRRFGTGASVDPFAPQRGTFPAITPANFPGAGNFVDFDTTLTVVSLFAEDALSITDRVTVIGGGRLEQFDVDRRVTDFNAGTQVAFGKLFKPASGRVGVVVDVVDQTQLYAQVTSAVAPVSTVPIISLTNAQFDLTTGRSWEFGVKSTLAGGAVEVTGSVFDVTQDDILTRDPVNPNITVQGGRQSSRGVEATVSVMPLPALRIEANATFMRAQFDELIEAGGANRSGNVPPNVPERLVRRVGHLPVGRRAADNRRRHPQPGPVLRQHRQHRPPLRLHRARRPGELAHRAGRDRGPRQEPDQRALRRLGHHRQPDPARPAAHGRSQLPVSLLSEETEMSAPFGRRMFAPIH